MKKQNIILFFIIVVSLFSRCDFLNDEFENLNTIKLSQNEFSGTYSVNDITLDFYHRNS